MQNENQLSDLQENQLPKESPKNPKEEKNQSLEKDTSLQSELSPKEMQLITTQKNRMIFLALLEAAMRYREGYFREELKNFTDDAKEDLERSIENSKHGVNKKPRDRGWERRARVKIEEVMLKFKNEQEAFNRTAYKELEKVVSKMSEGLQTKFDNYSTGFGLMAEEFLKARNTTDLLIVCKIYNMGLLEETLNEIKKTKEDENTLDKQVETGERGS